MNHMFKQLFAILMLLNCGASLLAYTFGITNTTDKKLVLKVKQRAYSGIFWGIVEPGDRIAFEFGGAHCLEWIKWSEFNPKRGHNGGQNLITPQGVDNAQFEKLGYPLYNSTIVMLPDELELEDGTKATGVYNETVAAAKELVKGHDKLACAIIDQVKSFMGIKAAEEVASGIGGAKKKEETDLIADFTKQANAKANKDNALKLILDMRKNRTKWLDLITEEAFNNVIDLLKPGTKVGNEAAIEFMNQALLDGPKAKKPTPQGGSSIKKPIIKDEDKEEDSALEKLLKELKGSDDDLDLKIDRNARINSSCCGDNINTYVDTKTTKPEIIKCNFGLKTIAGAAAKLEAISLCKDREYQLVEKAEPNKLTRQPEMWAFTVRGE